MFGQCGFASFHGATRHKYDGDVEAHCGIEHPGCDLVAVGNTHHRVCAVRVDHVLHRVGNQVPGRQAVQHAVMAHGDAVVHRDRIKFFGDAACSFDLSCDQLTEVFQVNVAWHKLREGVHDCDDGLFEILILHAGGSP